MATIDLEIWSSIQPMLSTNIDVVKNNHYYGMLIAVSVWFLSFLLVFVENWINVSIYTFYETLNGNTNFVFEQCNTFVLWAGHEGIMYFYGYVLSIYTAHKFDFRNKPLTNSLAFVLTILALYPFINVIIHYQHRLNHWMIYVLGFIYITRTLFTIVFIIGLNGYQTIEPGDYYIYKEKYDSIEKWKAESLSAHVKHNEYQEKKRDMGQVYTFEYKVCLLVVLIIGLIVYIFTSVISSSWTGDLIRLNTDNMVINWAVFGAETPLFGLAFHFGFLLNMFIVDVFFTRHWYPSYDLSLMLLLCVVGLGIWQITVLFICHLYHGDGIQHFVKEPLVISLSFLVTISTKVLYLIAFKMDTLYSKTSGFFLNN